MELWQKGWIGLVHSVVLCGSIDMMIFARGDEKVFGEAS